MKKTFIKLDSLQELIEKQLVEKFRMSKYFSSTIDVRVNLDSIVEEHTKDLPEPKIIMTTDAHYKTKLLVDQFSSEVAWHMVIDRLENNLFVIKDIIIFPQEVTGVTANGIDGEYEMFLHKLPDDIFNKLRGHGHSHVNMGVSPSGTDENYYTNLMTQVPDYYITLIINKKGETHLRLYDVQNNILYTDLTYSVHDSEGNSIALWFLESKVNVKDKVYNYTPVSTPTITAKEAADAYSSKNNKKKEAQEEKVKSCILTTPTGEVLPCSSNLEAAEYIMEVTKIGQRYTQIFIAMTLDRDGMLAIHKTNGGLTYYLDQVDQEDYDVFYFDEEDIK